MSEQPIIIKKIEEEGHGDHHGGGWKVAYADFMTAMMAFFLLLWILAASDEEKLRGLADYFTPSLSEAGGRGEGLLEGQVLGPEGVMSGTDGPMSEVQLPSFGQENPLAVFDSRLRDEPPEVVIEYADSPPPQGTAEEVDGKFDVETSGVDPELAQMREMRQQQLEALEDEIGMAIRQDEDLQGLLNNVRFEQTQEGLRVQIVDQEGQSMFDRGSARIEARTRKLIETVGTIIRDLPQPLVISGHTDAVPFSRRGDYSNWELSTDRANATRRVLIAAGVSPGRFARISGLAETEPLIPEDPEAPENRRISVLLQYPDPLLAVEKVGSDAR